MNKLELLFFTLKLLLFEKLKHKTNIKLQNVIVIKYSNNISADCFVR